MKDCAIESKNLNDMSFQVCENPVKKTLLILFVFGFGTTVAAFKCPPVIAKMPLRPHRRLLLGFLLVKVWRFRDLFNRLIE